MWTYSHLEIPWIKKIVKNTQSQEGKKKKRYSKMPSFPIRKNFRNWFVLIWREKWKDVTLPMKKRPPEAIYLSPGAWRRRGETCVRVLEARGSWFTSGPPCSSVSKVMRCSKKAQNLFTVIIKGHTNSLDTRQLLPDTLAGSQQQNVSR